MAQPIVSSDSSAPHTHSESNPSHLSSSQKVDTEFKGLVTSVGDNTLISDATPLATDPGQLSSNTAPADEALPSTHGGAEAEHSISDDPSAKSQAGDDEDIEPMDTDSESDEKVPPVTGASTAAVTSSVPVTVIPASTTASTQPPINVTAAPTTTTAAATPPATSAIPPSPLKELTHMSLSSDNLSKMEGDDLHNSTLAGDQGAQSNPPPSTKDTGDMSTNQLLMEFIASSQQQVKLLTEERNELKQAVSDLTAKVHSLASVYEPIPQWSESVSKKVKAIANAELNHAQALVIQSQSLSELASYTKVKFSAHDDTISTLTATQQAMADDMLKYINATDGMVAEMKRHYDWNRISRAEVRALRYDSSKLFRQVRSMMGTFNSVFSDSGEKMQDERIRKDMKDRLFEETYSLRTIHEMPEFEEQAIAEELAEMQQVDMILGDDEIEVVEILNFPEFSFDELRIYNQQVKEWAADEAARVQGETVSLEEKRWAYYEKYGPPKPKDVIAGADGNDDDNDDNDDDHMDEVSDDENMEDRLPISSINKRKRSADSSAPKSSSKSPPTKKHNTQVTDTTLSVTEFQISNPITHVTDSSTSVINFEYPPLSSSKEPESQLDSADVLATGYLSTSDYVIDDSVTFIQELPPLPPATQTTVTEQISLPLQTATVQPTEATTVTPISMSSSPIQTSALSLPSDSTSGSLHPNETAQQRIERKIRERRESEKEMLLKFQEELNRKEEEDRKRQLKIQSDADRDYMLKISEQDAIEREIQFRMKEEQEANDALIAQLAEEDEKLEYELELQQEKKTAKSKKKGGVSSNVDKMWTEIDRKRYAQRMIGRSNPAPITKVLLRKSKNKGQCQLQIHRGSEIQAIALDQVCKLHREEWNEIRLAVSHSTSAAKKEVIDEIERLFQKMVDLQLLRPEDTVILGEEIIRPPSPRYRAGTSRIQRVPNTSRLNLSIPDNVLRMEGTEVTEGDIGLVYRDLDGKLRFQREAELEKIDHEQLLHLIRCVSKMRKDSHMRTAILSEAFARRFRYLPSKDKYELADELDQVKQEEVWRDE